MKNNKAICSPDFYENVGFNTIRAWLGEHCLCTLIENYFIEDAPQNHASRFPVAQISVVSRCLKMSDYSLPPIFEDRFPVHITKHYLCRKVGDVDIWMPSKRGLNSKVNRGLKILRLQYIPCFCTFSETALKIEREYPCACLHNLCSERFTTTSDPR